MDLGIDEKYKPIIEKHIKFFANKERTQRFYDLEIENFNEENIITGLLSAICRTRTCSFEEVIRVILTDSELADNKFLSEVEKYGLLDDFWKLCEQHFGYTDVKPTLEKLVVTMFVTYTAKYVGAELPKAWKGFISYKAGNIIAFMDNLMNSILYRGRYEVGKELFRRMQDDPKCTAKLEVQLSVLPSYTRLGMAALLPHTELTMTDDFKVLVDGLPCENLVEREAILQKYNMDSVCVQFDSIKSLKIADLRSIFTGKQLVYVYHNQIDARGDKPNTEDEVFVACQEAIAEIIDLIRRISTSANTYRFIVTADHGFIYKRDKIAESDKIEGVKNKTSLINRRFVVSPEPVVGDGIASMEMGEILCNSDTKWVSYPISDDVFKVTGGGQNYVHGGSSPQEMLVPVLDLKMERGHMDTRSASLALVSMVRKITNKITILDLIQSEPVSDVVKAATYRLFFISDDNERISNENSCIADSRDQDASKRIFRMKFQFKEKKYDKDKQYFFVICDDATGLEVFRHPVIMDMAFADDYGFGF